MTKPAYVLVQLKVTDRERFGTEYGAHVRGQLAARDVEIISASPTPRVVEGDYPYNQTVLLKFPSEDVFDEWFSSEEYQPLKIARNAHSEADMTKMVVLPLFA